MKSSELAPKTTQTMLKYCAKTIPFLLATPLSLMPFTGINSIALESIDVEPMPIASTDLEIDPALTVNAAWFGSQAPDEIHIHFNEPSPPPSQGSPRGRQSGGAGRGQCGEYEGLTALMPVTDGGVWGQTTTDQPTLWFYSPTALTPDQPISLVVQDKSDNYLYQTTLALDMAPGLVAIQLLKEKGSEMTDSTTILPIAQPYHWTFFVECDPDRLDASVSVSGTFQKVEIEGLAPLSDTMDLSDVEQAIALAQTYATAGIWHDALTILGKLNRHHPSNPRVRATLASLLSQGGLADLAATHWGPETIQVVKTPNQKKAKWLQAYIATLNGL